MVGTIRKTSWQSTIHLPISDIWNISKHSAKCLSRFLFKKRNAFFSTLCRFIHSHKSDHVTCQLQTFQRLPSSMQKKQPELWHRQEGVFYWRSWRRTTVSGVEGAWAGGLRVGWGGEEAPDPPGPLQSMRKLGFTLRQLESQWKGLTRKGCDLTRVFKRSPPLFFSEWFVGV